jgi:hypothetical protein
VAVRVALRMDESKLGIGNTHVQPASSGQHFNVISHKGEVILVFMPPTSMMVLTPEQANSIGAQIIDAAERAKANPT